MKKEKEQKTEGKETSPALPDLATRRHPTWHSPETRPGQIRVYPRSFSAPQLACSQETARLCGWNHAGFQNAAFQEKKKTETLCWHILRKTFIFIIGPSIFLSWAGPDVSGVTTSAELPNLLSGCPSLWGSLNKRTTGRWWLRLGVSLFHVCKLASLSFPSTTTKWGV